jgi:hypothetical protein
MFLAFLLILVATSNLAAQQIKTAPSFASGQAYSLQLVETVEDVRDNPTRKTVRTPITLRVLRNSTSGMDLDWVAGKPTAISPAGPPDPIFEMAERIFENLHLTVHLDESGKYQGLRNEDELRAKIQEFILLLVPQTTAKIADPAERKRAAGAIAKAMTPQAMLSAARKEIDLYFGISGLPLEAGKPLRIKSSVMNPFGERGSLEGEMEITPGAVEAAKGEARIDFHQHFNPASAGPASTGFGSSARSSAARTPSAPDSARASSQLTLEDAGEYVLDLASGRVRSVRHVRTIFEGSRAVRVETTELTTR